jgi:hypothetical protein
MSVSHHTIVILYLLEGEQFQVENMAMKLFLVV